MSLYRLEELFPAELEHRLVERPLVILPFGTIEWHSYHLPIGLDSLKAQALCERIAERSSAVLGPLTPWAVGGVPFPHTIRFSQDLIEASPLSSQVRSSAACFSERRTVTVLPWTGPCGSIASRGRGDAAARA